MKRLLAVFTTTLLLSIAAAAQEHSTRPSRPRPRTPSAPPRNTPDAPVGWVKFVSDEGGFSVLMPGTPTETTETDQSEHGPYTTHLVTLRQAPNVFLIGWVEYDPSFNFNRHAELEANRDNFINGVKAQLLETRSTTFYGYPAIEFTAENANRVFRSRVFIVGRRPYQLVIGSPKQIDDSANINRFFNSFKVSP
jgi:hypothetical protein